MIIFYHEIMKRRLIQKDIQKKNGNFKIRWKQMIVIFRGGSSKYDWCSLLTITLFFLLFVFWTKFCFRKRVFYDVTSARIPVEPIWQMPLTLKEVQKIFLLYRIWLFYYENILELNKTYSHNEKISWKHVTSNQHTSI